jgi:hypothetical protein
MRVICHSALVAAFVLGAAPEVLRAQPTEPRIELARSLVQDRDGLLSPTKLYEISADLFCRSYFAELRRDAEWGPNHPNWSRTLPEFCTQLVQLALPEGRSLEDYLQGELSKALTATELSELDARNSDPAVVAASLRLQKRGLNWAFVVQAEKPPGTAGLFSSLEREAARRTAQTLLEKTPEVSADVRSVFFYLDTLSFAKYQRAVGQSFMNTAGRLDASPQGKFAAFMRAWHIKVSEAAR